MADKKDTYKDLDPNDQGPTPEEKLKSLVEEIKAATKG
jgi:hypothetical protein